MEVFLLPLRPFKLADHRVQWAGLALSSPPGAPLLFFDILVSPMFRIALSFSGSPFQFNISDEIRDPFFLGSSMDV